MSSSASTTHTILTDGKAPTKSEWLSECIKLHADRGLPLATLPPISNRWSWDAWRAFRADATTKPKVIHITGVVAELDAPADEAWRLVDSYSGDSAPPIAPKGFRFFCKSAFSEQVAAGFMVPSAKVVRKRRKLVLATFRDSRLMQRHSRV